jgi:thiol:disulfide interchange protein DsbD
MRRFEKNLLAALAVLLGGIPAARMRADDATSPAPILRPLLTVEKDHLVATVEIPDGYHIFAGKSLLGLDFQLTGGTLGEWEMPRPEREESGPVYRGMQIFRAPFTRQPGAASLAVTGKFRYQPCLEIGQKICYLPMKVPVQFDVSFPPAAGAVPQSAKAAAGTTSAPVAPHEKAPVGEPAPVAATPADTPEDIAGSCPVIISTPETRRKTPAWLVAFVGGLALNLTPCTWPLIPITLGVLGVLGAGVRRARALSLALGFAGGLVVIYALLGVLAALLGRPFGGLTQNAWIYLPMAGLFVLFGVFILRGAGFELPAGMGNRLHQLRGKMAVMQQGRAGWVGVVSAVVIGALSGLIISPCTGPLVAAAFLHVAQTRDVLYGLKIFTAIGAGMSLPFVLLGVFSAQASRLPRSGDWLEVVKRLLAALLFLAALYFVEQALGILIGTGPRMGWTLIGLAVVLAIMLSPRPGFANWVKRLEILVAAVFLAVVCFLAWPRAIPAGGAVNWRGDYLRALAEARLNHRPVIIDFWATWCAACKELEEKTYASAAFGQAAREAGFVLIKLDMTDTGTPFNRALDGCFQVQGLPTVIFIDAQGRMNPALTVTGFIPPADFTDRMHKLR